MGAISYQKTFASALKAHQAAVRALAFKWIRILYRCWQDRTLYDESTYLQALTQRGSLLMHNLAK